MVYPANSQVNNGGYMNPHCLNGGLNPRVSLSQHAETGASFRAWDVLPRATGP